MTTEANTPSDSANEDRRLERDSGEVETLRDLVELGRRLAGDIPEEERKAERAIMVAYLDEVAAREPSRRPDERAG
ncbi:MAG: hypothetical protein F4Y95_07670 [Chloroflexi bacterium]|nr:hypothetical protein [Chloroflexota bacterium]